MICEVAPAKVNLTLEILSKRDDGYHELRSVMQTIDICDVLTFWDNEWIHMVPEYHRLPSMDSLPELDSSNYFGKNLVYRAAELLKKETGYSGGALIQLKKNIPSAAGLGGGSSDAAAALKGLNRLWNLRLSNDELIEIGSKIGSDVAFFIHGGTCLIQGRGEKIIPLKPLPTKWLLIFLIPVAISEKTKTLYSLIDRSHYSDGSKTGQLIKKIEEFYRKGNGNDIGNLNSACTESSSYGGNGRHKFTGNVNNSGNGNASGTSECCITGNLFNAFEIVYNNEHGQFGRWKEYTACLDIGPLHLAGSGPAVYYLSDDEKDLIDLAEQKGSGNRQIIKYIARTVP